MSDKDFWGDSWDNRFSDMDCLKCGKTGLLSTGMCKQSGCGQGHKVRMVQ